MMINGMWILIVAVETREVLCELHAHDSPLYAMRETAVLGG